MEFSTEQFTCSSVQKVRSNPKIRFPDLTPPLTHQSYSPFSLLWVNFITFISIILKSELSRRVIFILEISEDFSLNFSILMVRFYKDSHILELKFITTFIDEFFFTTDWEFRCIHLFVLLTQFYIIVLDFLIAESK